ncbi:amidohydrolase family protein [Novosphingobium lentum]|uniref:amidohydrolase family protein n=1 Tax=Novosphingobium lentum TaxID=145287 RepID=UPI00082C4F4A|nr:amidohydrolase family protein [Novosphingobium lentum]
MALDVTGRYRYPSPDQRWLDQRTEDVIDPDQPIIDPHHHLWVQDGAPYLLDQIRADTEDGHRIVATVFVEAHYGYSGDGPAHLAPVGETAKVAAIAADGRKHRAAARIAEAIVARADLTLGDRVRDVLDAHALAAGGALRGIRHSVSNDPAFPDGIVVRPAPAGLLGDARYREGLRALAAAGLSYDAMLYSGQIGELTAMARALPDLAIVLDHVGCVLGVGPYEHAAPEQFARWRRDMVELAACPNVGVKVGGFGMIITGARWHEAALPPTSQMLADSWRPWVESCIELFGARRCMFESNFPVDKAMVSYRTLWNAFKRLARQASDDERHALFAGTAARTYRITDPAPGLRP